MLELGRHDLVEFKIRSGVVSWGFYCSIHKRDRIEAGIGRYRPSIYRKPHCYQSLIRIARDMLL